MQRDDDKLSMPGGFKSNRINSPYDDINNGGIQQHATSSVVNQEEPNATAMRATNVTNPHGGNYAIAGPTIGGAPIPYDSNKIEQAKEHLVGSMNENENQHDYSKNSILHADNTGSRHGRRPSLSEAVKTGATTAATGAAAAGASVIAAAKKLIQGNGDDDAEYRHDDDAGHILKPSADTTGLEFSHPHSRKPPGPGDRPPAKLGIHPKKPSDLALYGNFDSPGAHNHPGPLSDRALAGTPPLPVGTQHRTIADPFGPVKISNWNDGKRHPDAANPTSEEFDSVLSHSIKDRSENTFTAPGSGDHGPVLIHPVSYSPSKGESTMLAEDSSRHTHPTVPTSGHSPLRKEISYNNQNSSMGTGAKIGTGAAGLGAAGAAAAALRHDSEVHDQSAVPVYHIPTSQLPGSGTTHMPEEKRIPTAGPPTGLHRTTGTDTNLNRGANITDSRNNDADMHSHTTPKAAIVTVGTILGAAAIPAAMHHNQPDTITSTGAIPLSENIHADERHDRILSRNEDTAHAHDGKVPIRHNTSTIATTGAPPEVFLNRTEYVPAERVHHYKQHHQHFLPRDNDLDDTHTKKTGISSDMPVDVADLAGASAASYMGNKAGMGHHEKDNRPVNRTKPLGVHEHIAYLSPVFYTQHMSPGVGSPSTASTAGATVSPDIQTGTLHAQNTDTAKAHDSRPMTEKISAGVAAAAAATGAAAAGVATHLRRGSHDAAMDKDMNQPSVATTTAAGAPGTSNVVGDEGRTSTSALATSAVWESESRVLLAATALQIHKTYL
ncbi:hypothetical protein BG011_009912 [Mortierella polycephala]|uniref:Uncharacterized protein n=1 Tax=Mortierella polycephala TaxID=41804 RepID=A0A9P6PNF3_9FUNG|nr:hypothetical protein BG011_009912 [Mortierella polycephala]